MLADAERLRQILSNLLSNAVKFTPEGGSVVAQVRRNGPTVEFEVRDTGAGIDAKCSCRTCSTRSGKRRPARASRCKGLASG